MSTLDTLLLQLDTGTIISSGIIGFVAGATIIILDWKKKIRNQ